VEVHELPRDGQTDAKTVHRSVVAPRAWLEDVRQDVGPDAPTRVAHLQHCVSEYPADHHVMREGLRMVIERDGGLEVVGEADNGLQAIQLTRDLEPVVVVMDISMPELNGLRATEMLVALAPDTRVLILTRHSDSS